MAKPPRQSSFWQTFRELDVVTKSITIGLLTISMGGVGWFATSVWERNRSHKLILAAGNSTGESYILAKAIESVIEQKLPRIDIDVQETKGTTDNLARLAGTDKEGRKADLATAQSDVPAGSQARSIAVLYPDTFQVIVQGKSNLKKFTDLKGKRIGLAPQGGQYKSFLEVAKHFGLSDKDFTFVSSDDQSADKAFQAGQVDAVFRVRALGNLQVAELIQTYGGRLIPIDQAAAMRLKYPAFDPANIPRGAYKGNNPVVPETDLDTINVQRVLLTNASLDPELVKQITQALNENRRELQAVLSKSIVNTVPLVASIRRPETTGGTGIPIHPGALAYYERDEPSFLQANADYVALIMTVVLLIGSWVLELKNWGERRRQKIADQYIEQLIDVMRDCQSATLLPKEALSKIDHLFSLVADELVEEGISQESFQSFNETYQTVRAVVARAVH